MLYEVITEAADEADLGKKVVRPVVGEIEDPVLLTDLGCVHGPCLPRVPAPPRRVRPNIPEVMLGTERNWRRCSAPTLGQHERLEHFARAHALYECGDARSARGLRRQREALVQRQLCVGAERGRPTPAECDMVVRERAARVLARAHPSRVV